MPRLSRPRRASVALAVLSIALVTACGSTQVTPTGSAPLSIASDDSASPPTGTGPSTSPGSSTAGGASEGTVTPTPVPPDEPGTTSPPAGDPQADEACLAIVPRADVEAALGGASLGDIVAIGTDPAVSLTCTYSTTDGGSLLVATTAGDAAAAFTSSLDLATGYGQHPKAIDGLGDQAFYAVAADRWPEQVVVAKGPVLLRLVNETSATIGETAFAALAATAAEAIRAEIPPAP